MYELKVEGMTCGHCVKSVTSAVLAVDQAANVNVDLPSQTVRVASSAGLDPIKQAIVEAGYPVLSDKTI